MNLLTLITREESVAGLEVSDTFLRVALLGPSKEKTKLEIKSLGEEPLPRGVIEGNTVKNEREFIEALKRLFKKLRKKIRYVVVSLPSRGLYTKIFSFPKAVKEEKLEESMKLTLGFQLPVRLEEVYLDWEKIEGADESKVFLAALPRTVVDSYIKLLSAAGLKPIAVEVHPSSFPRVAKLPDAPLLVKELGGTDAHLFIVEVQGVQFSRLLPDTFLNEKLLEQEVQKLANFYEVETGQSPQIVNLNDTQLQDTYLDHPDIQKSPGTWAVALGAAARGLIPRAEDTLVSLLPVGTEEAYEYQKMIAFSEFFSSISIGLSVFFAVAFLGTWFFMTSLQERMLTQIEALDTAPAPGDAGTLEEQARNINTLVALGVDLTHTLPRWSPLVEELKARLVPGISIASFASARLEEGFIVNGTASGRSQLNLFKNTLEESPLFQNVNLPLTNLEQREHIPFSITFYLEDPQSVYVY